MEIPEATVTYFDFVPVLKLSKRVFGLEASIKLLKKLFLHFDGSIFLVCWVKSFGLFVSIAFLFVVLCVLRIYLCIGCSLYCLMHSGKLLLPH